MTVHTVSLTQALNESRTGDVWLFRGGSGPDRAIQTLTNAPINHVGMLERAAFIVIPSISAGIEPAEPFTLDDIELSALEVKISSIIGMAMIQMILYGIVALVVRSGVVHLWPWLQRQIITALAAAITVIILRWLYWHVRILLN